MICGLSLAAMSAAGLSHWWSVRQFVSAITGGIPVSLPLRSVAQPSGLAPTATAPPAPILARASGVSAPVATSEDAQKKFYEALYKNFESLQNQNRDLRDQIAETNRDVMQLGFRVDTHSESFRPMPVSEDRPDTSFDDGPGVLPPRAEPVPAYRGIK